MKNSKKITAIVTSVVMGTAVLSTAFAGCAKNSSQQRSVVSLDVNPGIELVLDKNDKVLSVYGTNEDGQVLLYGETQNLIGKSFAEAVDFITTTAVELNYLSEENKVVQYTVSSTIKGAESRLNGVIDSTVTSTTESLGLSFTVETDSEVAYSVYRRYEEYLKANPSFEGKLSVTDFKLALTASENGTITLDTAVNLNKEQLIQEISSASQGISEYATKAYNSAKASAEYAYDKLAVMAVNNVYAEYYFTNFLNHRDTAYLGYLYSSYSMSAMTLDSMADVAECAITSADKALSSEQTKSVLTALGMSEEQIDLLKDSQGNITVESVEAYANKLFKNSQASAELEEIKANLSTALNEAEAIIKEKTEKLSEEYAEQIEAIKSKINSLSENLGSLNLVMPEGFRTAIADMQQVAEKLTYLTADGVSISDVREIADEMQTLADSTLKKIEADLTKQELAEIEQKKQEKEAQFASAKTEMQAKIAEAETSAKAWLQSLKDARKQA
ncbi:MAG: hypothetical protein ACI4MS_01590 [Candidatus Coproplasma sp.]